MIRLRARWLFPGEGPPVPHAVLTIHEGRVVSVVEGSLSQSPCSEIDLGQVALIPGLINTHTHLEFSDLSSPLEPRERFADWIAAVISSRQAGNRDPVASIQQGLRESRENGVSGLAEIATTDWIFNSPPDIAAPRIFAFREILGLQPDRVDAQLGVADRFLKQAAMLGRQDVGLSPHASYSLHPRLFAGLVELAVAHHVPVAMHLAESPAEMELLRTGSGPLVDLFTRMGIWVPGVLAVETRPLSYLQELARAPRGLVVHGNFLDEEELRFIAANPQLSVVYCPRTHRAMQPGTHPWRHLLRLGANVTLGTDSRASNPDLSLWKELQLLHADAPDLSASSLLQLATANAAHALGWESSGRLLPGFRADFGMIPLSEPGIRSPERFLFDHPAPRVPSPELLGH